MATIRLPSDFKEFLQLLNEHGVEYLLVGAYAVNFHGYVRTTGDMDVWAGVSNDNAEKISKVLHAFGFSAKSIEKELFLREDKIFQMGIPPTRIDLLMHVSGLDFEASYSNRETSVIDGVPVSLLSYEDLVTNKKASGRPKDLADLDNLP